MAGAKSRLHKASSTTPSKVPGRQTQRGRASREDNAVPGIFQDMLSEAKASKTAGPNEDGKALKRRRTTHAIREETYSPDPELKKLQLPVVDSQSKSRIQPSQGGLSSSTVSDGETASDRIVQTIVDSDESEDSDFEWEDALGDDNGGEGHDDEDTIPDIGDISITIGGQEGEEKLPAKRVRRRGITLVDRKRRLDIHKMHVLCLLYHTHRRNAWCNDERVQATLRRLPSAKALENLVPNPEFTQYQASKRFIDGMQELEQLWSNRFSVTALGMHKPRWADADGDVQSFEDFNELDDPMDKQDFRRAASLLQGSQDVGAQLFCALLRSIGVDARLVCSLQCLPFASAAQSSTPQKPSTGKQMIHLDPYNKRDTPSPSKAKATTSSRPKRLSRLERVLGERNPALSSGVAPKQRKKYHSAYPVYWVEVLNAAHQKWVSIDPLSTFTVDRPDKLEPPLNESQNSLVYAIAFEDDLSGRDVTRRYAKAYSAKTRKFRVDSTEDGQKWWKRALKPFKRGTVLDRDQVEHATLARKEAAEGIPKNMQDFKNHPLYVLERHLKHNEIIHSTHQVGKVNAGTAMNPRMEPIYRRSEVHTVRSADKWYRLGRDVRGGEQPLKHAKPKKRARSLLSQDMDIDDPQEETGAGLYAAFQTEAYVPPPIVDGRVPRNAFGNLDVYVPSMIPEGGAHVRHKLAAKAARVVGVDYADAVTGFAFKGRHGTAILQGVIVAREYMAAVEAALDAMEYAQAEAENSQRSSEALRLWRRFYIGLKIAQRVNAIEIEGEIGPQIDVQQEIDREDKALVEQHLAGGFFLAQGDVVGPPTSVMTHHENEYSGKDLAGNSPVDEGGHGGGFIPEVVADHARFGSTILERQQLRPRQEEDFDLEFIRAYHIEQHDAPNRKPLLAAANTLSSDHEIEGGFIQNDGATDLKESITPDKVPINDVVEGIARKAGVNGTANIDLVSDHGSMAVDNTIASSSVGATLEPRIEGFRSETKSPHESPLPVSSPSEVGSLPLEDPEDEDADPDWLVDVT